MKQLQRDNQFRVIADPKSSWVEITPEEYQGIAEILLEAGIRRPEEYLHYISPTARVVLRVLFWHIQLLRGQPQDPIPEGP